jgi:hypothetical protein
MNDYQTYRDNGLLHDECHPDALCCDQCLINLGFEIDKDDEVTLQDVIDSNTKTK